ncbi:MAG TPA: hypothetical protein VII08_19505 [Myxococcales bacterium]
MSSYPLDYSAIIPPDQNQSFIRPKQAEVRVAMPTPVPAPVTPKVAPTTAADAPERTRSPQNPLEKPYLTIADLVVVLQAPSAKAIYAMYERGQLPRSVHPGRRILIARDELLQFLSRASSSARRIRR